LASSPSCCRASIDASSPWIAASCKRAAASVDLPWGTKEKRKEEEEEEEEGDKMLRRIKKEH